LKRIAFVGVSHDPKEFSYTLWQEFRQRRYEAIPVNPNVAALDGQACYKRVQDIKPAVDGVMIMTSSKFTEQIVRDCAEAGVKHVWMYKGVAAEPSTRPRSLSAQRTASTSWKASARTCSSPARRSSTHRIAG